MCVCVFYAWELCNGPTTESFIGVVRWLRIGIYVHLVCSRRHACCVVNVNTVPHYIDKGDKFQTEEREGWDPGSVFSYLGSVWYRLVYPSYKFVSLFVILFLGFGLLLELSLCLCSDEVMF